MDRTEMCEPVILNARWYEGVSGLKQLRAEWLELAQGADLFARFEWNLAAAMHLVEDGQTVSFCRIGDNRGRVVAIIPAFTGALRVRPFGELRALSLGWDPQLAAFDFPLAGGADAGEVGRTMLKAFKKHPYAWNVISWPRVMANSNAARLATALSRRITDITPFDVCNTFYTGSAPDPAAGLEIYKVKSSSLRRNLANRTRRLAQNGPIQMRMAREQGDIEGFFETFLRIEASGWKGENGTRTAIALVPSALAFYKSLIAESNEDFQTDVAMLYSGEDAVAGQFIVRVAGWEHVYKIGYDEAFTECSPGQILHQLVIEHAKVTDGIDRVSLVTGLGWHKDWKPLQEPTLQIHIFRSIWRALLVHWGRSVLARFRKARQWFARKSQASASQGQKQSDSSVGQQSE